MIIKFWEIYFLDEDGNRIDHTPENHQDMKFLDGEQAWNAYYDYWERGIPVEIWKMDMTNVG